MKFQTVRRNFLCILCLTCLLYFPSVLHAQQSPSVYAITHAKIVTLAGSAIENGTLVIRDGKIAAVGASVDVPSGAQAIDGHGLQVYPGLFDPVTQIGLSEISAVSSTVDSSETGSYNPDIVAATAVLPSSEHIPVTRASGITEVLAVPGSGGFDFSGSRSIIAGQASAFNLAGWTVDEMQLKRSVAMVLNWPEIQTRTFDFATFSRKEKPTPTPSRSTTNRSTSSRITSTARVTTPRPSAMGAPLISIVTSNSNRSRPLCVAICLCWLWPTARATSATPSNSATNRN
jgi:hypothetical protein